MHPVFRCAGLLMLLLAVAAPTMTAGQNQDKKNDDSKTDAKKADVKKQDTKAKAKEKPKIDWSAEFVGKITELSENEDAGLTFTIQVNYKYPELNPDSQRQIAQHQQTLAQQQLQLARAKTVQDRNNIVGQMANTQTQLEQAAAQLYKLKDVNFDVKCKPADNLRVRKFEPALPIDPETGEFIKMTKAMLEEAKGREGYPGYKADSKILAAGQMVKAFVWKDSKTPANFLDKDKQAKLKADDMQAELKKFRYDIIMIYVATDAPAKGKS